MKKRGLGRCFSPVSLALTGGLLLGLTGEVRAFTITTNQNAGAGSALTGTLSQSISKISGDGVPDGTPNPFLYDWDDVNGSADLDLGTNKIYSSSGLSFALDLGRGGVKGNIIGTGALALQTTAATLTTATYPTIPETAVNYSGSVTITNVGNISMGGISTRISDAGAHQYRGSITIGQDGTAGPRAGNIRVNYLDTSGALWFGGSRGATGGITIYSDGDVKIQSSDNDATAVLGDILCNASQGGAAPAINIQHQGSFRARNIDNSITVNWPSVGSYRASITNRGDVAGAPGGTFLANNIYTYYGSVGFNNRPTEGNVTISGYTGVRITGDILAYCNQASTAGGSVWITNIVSGIAINGTVNLNSPNSPNETFDGTLLLQTTGTVGVISVGNLDLRMVKSATCSAGSGTNVILRELLNFPITTPTASNLSATNGTPSGGTIYYNPLVPGNLYLAGATYSLGTGKGTLTPLTPAAATAVNWISTGDTSFETGPNWDSGAAPTNDVTTQTATFSAKGVLVDPVLTTSRSVAGVNFTAAGWTLSANPATNVLAVGLGGVDSAGSGANVIRANILLGDNGSVWTVGSGNELIVSNAISGTSFLTKTGAGTLTLATNNTLTNAVGILGGILNVRQANALATSMLVVTGGVANLQVPTATVAALGLEAPDLIGGGQIVLGNTDPGGMACTLTAGDARNTTCYASLLNAGSYTGSLIKVGSGSLTLAGSNILNNLLLSAGTLVLAGPTALAGTSTLTNGTLFLQGGNVTLAGAATVNGATVTVSGTNNNFNGGLTLNAGTVTFAGASTLGGNVTVNGGTLQFTNAPALASGTIIVNGGTVQSSSAAATTNSGLTILAAPMTFGGTGALVFTNLTTLSGVPVLIVSAPVTFAGSVAGGALFKAGAGMLTLAATNSFSGALTVFGGTLQMTASGTLGSNAPITI